MTEKPCQHVGPLRSTPKRALVLGSTGMVGRAWCNTLHRLGIPHTGVHRPVFDLHDPDTIDSIVNNDFDLVVNAAAWTDVDGAEEDNAGADRSNAYALRQIAQRCAEGNATLIAYSTDYVFNGHASKPYPVDAPIEPINAYGRSKALGESLLREVYDNYILIRTSWVHAPWGKNFVLTMRSLLTSRNEISVVDDQRGRPTSAISIAQGSLDLYSRGALGTWHLTDAGECTWHELATEIRDALGACCEVLPCSSDAFPRPASRPAYSTLCIEQTEELIGSRQDWRKGVERTLLTETE
jgi:dTDP-4-dehydrorhamnose reductase